MPRFPIPPTKLDPVREWQAWEPDAGHPWNLQRAGHLYRRAGFGANLVQLREAVQHGYKDTIERVLHGEPGAEERTQFLHAMGERVGRKNNIYELRSWWLYAMLHTLHPLREKMTLFWHNHFVSSIAKVQRAQLMFIQNRLLREHALGKFGPFVLAVSKDPAMLIYLDNYSNVKGRPNENYARELMELFSLGVGNYTEQDIREAARAFTGWHSDDIEFEFDPRVHDDGPKTVFGKTGPWNGDDIVRLCLEKECAATFIVRKLYRFFISETHVPPDSLLEPLAEQFRKSDYDIAALVCTMLHSRHFFSEHAYHQRLKSPVEYAIGTLLAVVSLETLTKGQVSQEPLITRLESMGQPLFAPPNVKGWPGGKNWLNTSTVLARHNFAQELASADLRSGRRPPANPEEEAIFEITEANQQQPQPPKDATKPRPAPVATLDVVSAVRREKATKPAEIVQVLFDLLLQSDVAPESRRRLEQFLADGNPEKTALDWRIRDAAHTIMTMPEYELA